MSGNPSGGNPSGSGRGKTIRVRTARQRRPSSTAWLQRQLNDPYVAASKRDGYRSRAAYKLLELDERAHLLRPGLRVVDLGCAPGGWLQVAVKKGARVIGIDRLPTEPVPGAEVIELDFLADEAPDRLKALLGGPADLVLSDMAASATGHAATDHLRVVALAEAAYAFALEVLAPDGAFVAKVFQGGSEREFLQGLKRDFQTVRHIKPPASRAESAEVYVVAQRFRGGGDSGSEV